MNPDYKDFFSEKVGLNIALSRARISLLEEKKLEARKIFKARELMYREALDFNNPNLDYNEIDPTGRFLKRVKKSYHLYQNFYQTLKQEQTALNNYIKELGNMIISI